MISAGDSQVRRVYIELPHSANPKPPWYGESVGHYEGDTLVIDTIGLNDHTFVDNYRTPHSEMLHVIERWNLIDEGNMLEVNIRVEDPDTYYEPWSGIQHFRRVQQQMWEEVCAENPCVGSCDTALRKLAVQPGRFLARGAFRVSGTAVRYLGALPDRLLLREGVVVFRSLVGSISGGIAFSNHLSRGRDGFGPVFRSSSRSRPST